MPSSSSPQLLSQLALLFPSLPLSSKGGRQAMTKGGILAVDGGEGHRPITSFQQGGATTTGLSPPYDVVRVDVASTDATSEEEEELPRVTKSHPVTVHVRTCRIVSGQMSPPRHPVRLNGQPPEPCPGAYSKKGLDVQLTQCGIISNPVHKTQFSFLIKLNWREFLDSNDLKAEGIPPKLNRRSRSSARGCESTLILGSLPLHLPLAIVGSGEAWEGVRSFPSPSSPTDRFPRVCARSPGPLSLLFRLADSV